MLQESQLLHFNLHLPEPAQGRKLTIDDEQFKPGMMAKEINKKPAVWVNFVYTTD